MAKNTFSDGAGPSQRQLRVGEVVRRTLGEALARGDTHDPDLARMSITITEVAVSPDLRIATVYAMPLGGKGRDGEGHKAAIDALAGNKGELKRIIGRKSALKYVPDLRFRIDDTFDRMDDTRALFDRDEVKRDLSD